MIDVLYYYSIAALSTGIFSVFNIFLPVVNLLKLDKQLDHAFVTNFYLSCFTFTILSTLAAPFFISTILSEDKRLEFIQGFLDGAE